MVEQLRSRTKITNNDPMLIQELNAALDEVWKRLYSVFPNVQITFDTEGTFAVDTQEMDLGADIVAAGGVFYGSKTFYIKGAADQYFVPVAFMDTNDPRFQGVEQAQAQVLQPCFASLVNFDKIRFAPTLPAGTKWRSDWIGKPPNLSLSTNTQTSIPEPLHQAMCDVATGTVFGILDDSREEIWSARGMDKIRTAIHAIKTRQNQTPFMTRSYPGGSNDGLNGGSTWPQG